MQRDFDYANAWFKWQWVRLLVGFAVGTIGVVSIGGLFLIELLDRSLMQVALWCFFGVLGLTIVACIFWFFVNVCKLLFGKPKTRYPSGWEIAAMSYQEPEEPSRQPPPRQPPSDQGEKVRIEPRF